MANPFRKQSATVNLRRLARIDSVPVKLGELTTYALESRTAATQKQLDAREFLGTVSNNAPLYCRKTGAKIGSLNFTVMADAEHLGLLLPPAYTSQLTHPAWVTMREGSLADLQLSMPYEFCVYTASQLFYDDKLTGEERHAVLQQLYTHELPRIVELAELLRRIAALLGKHVKTQMTFDSHRQAELVATRAAIVQDIPLRAAHEALATVTKPGHVDYFNRHHGDAVSRRDIVTAALDCAPEAYAAAVANITARNAQLEAAASAILLERLVPFKLQYADIEALLRDLRAFFARIVRELHFQFHKRDLDRLAKRTLTASDVARTHVTLGMAAFARRGNGSKLSDDKLLAELHELFGDDSDWNVSFTAKPGSLSTPKQPRKAVIAIDLDADEPPDHELEALAASFDGIYVGASKTGAPQKRKPVIGNTVATMKYNHLPPAITGGTFKLAK